MKFSLGLGTKKKVKPQKVIDKPYGIYAWNDG